MLGFSSCPSGSYKRAFIRAVDTLRGGRLHREVYPRLVRGNAGTWATRAQDRDTLAVEVTSKVVHYHIATPKVGTPQVATPAVQSVAVTVAVDQLSVLIEVKPRRWCSSPAGKPRAPPRARLILEGVDRLRAFRPN